MKHRTLTLIFYTEKEEITNEEVVLKTLSSVNASPLLKKRNGLSQNPDTIQDEVQEENQSGEPCQKAVFLIPVLKI